MTDRVSRETPSCLQQPYYLPRETAVLLPAASDSAEASEDANRVGMLADAERG